MLPSEYLDVGPAIAGGYRVALIKKQDVIRAYVLMETALDTAAAARLCGLPILTSDQRVIEACRALGVAIVAPPPRKTRILVLRSAYDYYGVVLQSRHQSAAIDWARHRQA